MPCTRHRSATLRPASPSLTIARICSSVNLLRFIGPPRTEGLSLWRGGFRGAGQRPMPTRADFIRNRHRVHDSRTAPAHRDNFFVSHRWRMSITFATPEPPKTHTVARVLLHDLASHFVPPI